MLSLLFSPLSHLFTHSLAHSLIHSLSFSLFLSLSYPLITYSLVRSFVKYCVTTAFTFFLIYDCVCVCENKEYITLINLDKLLFYLQSNFPLRNLLIYSVYPKKNSAVYHKKIATSIVVLFLHRASFAFMIPVISIFTSSSSSPLATALVILAILQSDITDEEICDR